MVNVNPEEERLRREIGRGAGRDDVARLVEILKAKATPKPSRRRKPRPGDRVRVGEGAGVDSRREGVVIRPQDLRTDHRGVPLLAGHYNPVNWKRETAFRTDDGDIVIMFDSYLNIVEPPIKNPGDSISALKRRLARGDFAVLPKIVSEIRDSGGSFAQEFPALATLLFDQGRLAEGLPILLPPTIEELRVHGERSEGGGIRKHDGLIDPAFVIWRGVVKGRLDAGKHELPPGEMGPAIAAIGPSWPSGWDNPHLLTYRISPHRDPRGGAVIQNLVDRHAAIQAPPRPKAAGLPPWVIAMASMRRLLPPPPRVRKPRRNPEADALTALERRARRGDAEAGYRVHEERYRRGLPFVPDETIETLMAARGIGAPDAACAVDVYRLAPRVAVHVVPLADPVDAWAPWSIIVIQDGRRQDTTRGMHPHDVQDRLRFVFERVLADGVFVPWS